MRTKQVCRLFDPSIGLPSLTRFMLALDADVPVVSIPTIKDYYMDLDQILDISSDGPSKSFAYRRLQYLEGKWNLYILLNEYQEIADSKVRPRLLGFCRYTSH